MRINALVNKMEVFHNNERLLIVNATKNGVNQIYIINVKTKKVVNVMKQPDTSLRINSILTFTVIQKPPEIFFMFFSKDKLRFCNIDDRNIEKEVRVSEGKIPDFGDVEAGKALVKIVG